MAYIVHYIFSLWEEILYWVIDFLNSVIAIFWTASEGGGGQLTFLGTIALISLGISVIFLMIRVVQNFLHFRG